MRAVEHRRGDRQPEHRRRPAEMRLHDLPEVHARRHAQRVEHDVDRRSVVGVRHVFFRQHLGDDALVAVPARHLVALQNLALLRDVDAHEMVHARGKFVAVLAREALDVDDLALFAVRHFERGVAHFARLLAEDRAQQALFRRQFGLALGRDFADQDVFGPNLGADAHDSVLVEILERIFADVGDVAGDLFGSEFRVAGFALVLLDVNRGEAIVLDHAFADQNRVFVVVAFPRHERDEHVLTERQLALFRRRTIGKDLPAHDAFADRHDRFLIDARAGIGAGEFEQVVLMIEPVVVVLERDRLRVDADDFAGARARARSRRNPWRRDTPCRCRRSAPADAATARPAAACSRP